jgi:hypothetical protein
VYFGNAYKDTQPEPIFDTAAEEEESEQVEKKRPK